MSTVKPNHSPQGVDAFEAPECIQCQRLLAVLEDDDIFSLRELAAYSKQQCEVCKILQAAIVCATEAQVHHRKSSRTPISTLPVHASFTPWGVLQVGCREYQLYHEADEPLRKNISQVIETRQHLQEDSSSPACFQLAKDWFKNCISNHPECRHTTTHLPTRIIMIEHGLENPKLKLVQLATLKADFVALSHRWASDGVLKLTTANFHTLQEDIPWSDIPKTFRDAVTVCTTLGIRYIWIDSLCILQDSPSDWQLESSRMGNIYRNAILVRAAGTSTTLDRRSGFLGPRKGHSIQFVGKLSYSQAPLPLDVYAMPDICHFRVALVDDPLSHRGWAYQERLLARRFLAYNPPEMLWECESSKLCECGKYKKHNNSMGGIHDYSLKSLLGHSSTEEIYTAWLAQVVFLYSEWKLTFNSDKLPALSGVSSLFQERLQDEYLAGLWKGDLVRGLGWSSRSQEAHLVPDRYQAPSWSWAEVNGGVSFGLGSIDNMFADVISVKCDTSVAYSTGPVTGGHIILKAPLVEALVKVPIDGINSEERPDLAIETESQLESICSWTQDAALKRTVKMTIHGESDICAQRVS